MHRLPHAFAAAVLIACMAGPVAADPIRVGDEHCVVNVRQDDPLNLRAGPGTGYAVLARLAYSSCAIMVTEACSGFWCPVEAAHRVGWVHRRHIARVSEPKNCLSPMTRPHSVALRAWPSSESRVLTRLAPRSCGIALLPYTVGGWQKVRQDGWEGWLRLSDLLFIEG